MVAGGRGRARRHARDLRALRRGRGTFSSLTEPRMKVGAAGRALAARDGGQLDADGRQHVPVSLAAFTERRLAELSVHLVGGCLVPEAGAALRHGARDDDPSTRSGGFAAGGTRYFDGSRGGADAAGERERRTLESEGCSRGRRARASPSRASECSPRWGSSWSPAFPRALRPGPFRDAKSHFPGKIFESDGGRSARLCCRRRTSKSRLSSGGSTTSRAFGPVARFAGWRWTARDRPAWHPPDRDRSRSRPRSARGYRRVVRVLRRRGWAESITEISASALRLPPGSGRPGVAAEPSARDATEHEYLRAPRPLRALFRPPRRRERPLASGVEAHVRRGAGRAPDGSDPEDPRHRVGGRRAPRRGGGGGISADPAVGRAPQRMAGRAAPVAPGSAASGPIPSPRRRSNPGRAALRRRRRRGLVILRVPAPSPGTRERSPGTMVPGGVTASRGRRHGGGSPFGVLAPSHSPRASSPDPSPGRGAPGTAPGPNATKPSPGTTCPSRRRSRPAPPDAGRANPPGWKAVPSPTRGARSWASSRHPWRVRQERRARTVSPRVQTPPTTPTAQTSLPWCCPSRACAARSRIFPPTRRRRANPNLRVVDVAPSATRCPRRTPPTPGFEPSCYRDERRCFVGVRGDHSHGRPGGADGPALPRWR